MSAAAPAEQATAQANWPGPYAIPLMAWKNLYTCNWPQLAPLGFLVLANSIAGAPQTTVAA